MLGFHCKLGFPGICKAALSGVPRVGTDAGFGALCNLEKC